MPVSATSAVPVRPDPDRLGGLAWGRRTQGSLTAAERRRLLGALAKQQYAYLLGRTKLALGCLPPRARELDVTTF